MVQIFLVFKSEETKERWNTTYRIGYSKNTLREENKSRIQVLIIKIYTVQQLQNNLFKHREVKLIILFLAAEQYQERKEFISASSAGA